MPDCTRCSCDKHRHDLCAHHVPIFTGLNDEELSQVVSLIVHKETPKGASIFAQGDETHHLFIINHGRVKLVRYTPDGKEQILHMLEAGDFFGERNILGRSAAPYFASAVEDTFLCTIHRDDFQRLILQYPGISIKVMTELCRRMDSLENLSKNANPREMDARISALLLEFAEKYGEPNPDGIMIDLPLSREGMASYIGATRETISRKLTQLDKAGTIRLIGNKRILLLKKELLLSS